MPPSAAFASSSFVARRQGSGASGASSRERAVREVLRAPLESASFFARAWAAAFAVEGSLRLVGYKRTLAWIEAIPKGSARRPRTSVMLGERLVGRAYTAHPLAGGCLPRSLVQYLLHRRDGTEARLVVGVRRPAERATGALSGPANEKDSRGIEAHAWVEDHGSVPSGAEPFAPIFSSGEWRRPPRRDSVPQRPPRAGT